MDAETPRYARSDLIEFAASCISHFGVANDDAEIAADVLVSADMRGVHSHGLLLLTRYCTQLREGGVVPRPKYEVVREAKSRGMFENFGEPARLLSPFPTLTNVALAEMFLRLAENVHAPYYALFIVGPAADLVVVYLTRRRGPK